MNPNRQSKSENVGDSPLSSAVIGTTYITMPTPQSVMDEFYHSNKQPLPSGKSPRQEKLLQHKTASEEKLRSLVHSVTESLLTDIPRTTEKESEVQRLTSQASKSRQKKPSQRGRTGRTSTTTSRDSQTHSYDDDMDRRPTWASEPRRRRKKTKQGTSSRTKSRSQRAMSKSDSPESGNEWGIPSVMGDSTESWQHFEPSDAEFSESGYQYDDSSSSRRSSTDVDIRIETTGSLLDQPSSLSMQIVRQEDDDDNEIKADRFPPMPKARDWLSDDEDDDDDADQITVSDSNHPTLSRPSYQGQVAYSSQRRGETVSSSSSSIQQSNSTNERTSISNADQQQSKRTSSKSIRQVKERKQSLKRQKSMQSNPSLESTNPTPSVIAKGVKEVAAKLDVNLFQPSYVPTTKEKLSRLELLLNENNMKAKLREALQARLSQRKSMRKSSEQVSVQSESYELVMGDGAESMSTLSHDIEFDPAIVIPSTLEAMEEEADTRDDAIEFSSFTSRNDTTASYRNVYEHTSNSEQLKVQGLSRSTLTFNTSKRSKLRSSTQSLLADVLEVSVEGSGTDDDSPARIQSLDTIVSTNPLPSVTLDTNAIYSSEQLLHDYRHEESVEVAYPEQLDDLETRNINSDDTQSEVTIPLDRRSRKSCRLYSIMACTAFLLIAATVVVIVIIYVYPKPPRTFTNDEIFTIISSISTKDKSVFNSSTTIQGKALIWLQQSTMRRRQSDRKRILQRFALASLYFSTQGENWLQKSGWLSDDDECKWFFTLREPCNEEGTLMSLSLSSNNLAGEIPEESAIILSSLVTCDLQKNRLTGTLPKALVDCINLQQLDLSSNWFDPEFPSWITRLTNLSVLNLDMNLHTGSLPSSLSRMTNLKVFSLAGNRLTGKIPTDIAAMTALRVLNLKFNQLSGPIPGELGLLRNLSDLVLDVNPFYDNFPTEIFQMSDLRQLSCNYCSLRGRLPTELGMMKNIESLDFRSNQWIGTIPSTIGLISKVRRIDFSGNQLSGTLPRELGQLTSLSRMDFSRNNLTGSIPMELSSLYVTDLVIHLDGNLLTGSIPSSLCIQLKAHGGLLSLNETEVDGCK